MKANTAKYTPGPWSVLEDEHSDENGKFHKIADCQDVTVADVPIQPLDPQEWSQANARLIAAAPELLEALKALKKELWAANLKLDVKKHFSLLAADAQAGTAIHKVEGGQNG